MAALVTFVTVYLFSANQTWKNRHSPKKAASADVEGSVTLPPVAQQRSLSHIYQ